jgi:YidC/Oxa1 family membrane protein insertase
LDRNTFLAIVLSLAVLVGWSMYQAQFAPPPREAPGTEAVEPPAAEEIERAQPPLAEVVPAPKAPSPEVPPLPAPDAEEQILIFEKPLYTAEFTTRGAGLRRWELREYDHGPAGDHAPIVMTTEREPVEATLLTPFLELGLGDLAQAIFEVESEDDTGVSFRYSHNGITVRKIYSLDEDSYSFRLRLDVENASSAPITPEFGVHWPAAKSETQDFKDESFTVLHDGEVENHAVAGLGSGGFFGSIFGGGPVVDPEYRGEIDWAGIQTTYFLGVLLPDNPARAEIVIETVEAGDSGVAKISFPSVQLPPGQATDQQFRAYLGPKEQERLERMGGDTVRSIDLGWSWIEPLVRGFNWLLLALYTIVPNYGVAIILLTILVRVVTMPLTNRQMRSMERMREVQPKVKALQEKHGDDRQKQSEEMMKLYRAEGVNPLGGCFPMLLQLPVFIGLFYALRSSIQLRQAPFVGWINDLSAPETLFTIPGIEIPVRVLPLVMGVSMVLQQKITPTASVDPAQARMMMTIMPVMMTVLFYQFPSGLVLYWFVSNILAIAHQLLIGRRMRGASGTASGGG